MDTRASKPSLMLVRVALLHDCRWLFGSQLRTEAPRAGQALGAGGTCRHCEYLPVCCLIVWWLIALVCGCQRCADLICQAHHNAFLMQRSHCRACCAVSSQCCLQAACSGSLAGTFRQGHVIADILSCPAVCSSLYPCSPPSLMAGRAALQATAGHCAASYSSWQHMHGHLASHLSA
jgi:hypothetical protein